jgi:hypothetical protein
MPRHADPLEAGGLGDLRALSVEDAGKNVRLAVLDRSRNRRAMLFAAAMIRILPDILDFHSLPTTDGVNMLSSQVGGVPWQR